jgi:hypothetical protein
LKGLKEVLSDSELKDVTGGVTQQRFMKSYDDGAGGGSGKPCDGKKEYDSCVYEKKNGICRYAPFSGLVCHTGGPVCG